MSTLLSAPPQADTLLKNGIRALHGSDKPRARLLLQEAVQVEPQNEQAWLWLSGAVETDVERWQCLSRVLELNPQNEAARLGLKRLGLMVAANPAAPAAPSMPSSAALPTLPAAPVSLPAATAPSVAVMPQAISLPAPLPTAQLNTALDPVFLRDRFLLKQKIAIAEKYQVWDDQNNPILFVERPLHLLRGLLSICCALIVMAVTLGLGLMAASALPAGAIRVLFLLVYISGSAVLGISTAVMISKKRHVTFYRDEAKREPLVTVLQDHKFFLFNATYTVTDTQGQLLARLRKNHLYNILRKRWYCYAPDGLLLCVAKEDSLLRSMLRRSFSQLGVLGALFAPLLMTNFVIMRGSDGGVAGMLNRKFKLLDHYVLDMSADAGNLIDRRVALALGVMLDTGERR